jgi:hypothetical protein
MKISRLKIPEDHYLRSANGPLAICSIFGGIVATILIIATIAQIPKALNLWLALVVSVAVVVASVAFIMSDRKSTGAGDRSDGADNGS